MPELLWLTPGKDALSLRKSANAAIYNLDIHKLDIPKWWWGYAYFDQEGGFCTRQSILKTPLQTSKKMKIWEKNLTLTSNLV